MAKKQNLVRMMISLPPDMREWLAKKTETTFATMNREVIRSVKERMDREKAGARGQRALERA